MSDQLCRPAQDARSTTAVLLQDDRWKGLALCEVGSRFGFAAKIASVPILAATYLSGGATAAGLLVSAAGARPARPRATRTAHGTRTAHCARSAHGTPARLAHSPVSAAGLSGLLGAPLGGLLTDRKGARFVSVRRPP